MRFLAGVLWLFASLSSSSVSAIPVTWVLEFLQDAQPIGSGAFSYEPETLEVICPAVCDDPSSPFYTPLVEVRTLLESFTASIAGYSVGHDQIAWWSDPPDHRAGHVAYSRYTHPQAAEDFWFFGDPFFGSPHQFVMQNFSEQADGSWTGDWFLSVVVPGSNFTGGGEWRATVVPEPTTVVLLGAGLLAMAARRR